MKIWYALAFAVNFLIGLVCVLVGRYDQAAANLALAIIVHLWSKEVP